MFFWQINHHHGPNSEVLFFCTSSSFSLHFVDTETAVIYNWFPLVCNWEMDGHCCVTVLFENTHDGMSVFILISFVETVMLIIAHLSAVTPITAMVLISGKIISFSVRP